MNALSALEFDRIRVAVAAYTATAEAREGVVSLQPLFDPGTIAPVATEIGEILQLLATDITPPGGDVPILTDVFAVLHHKGEILQLDELVGVRALLETSAEFRRFFGSGEDEQILTLTRSDRLNPPRDLRRRLRTVITGEGTLNEDAIPEIVALRRRITTLHQELQRSSETIIRSNRTMYREDRATVRDGRTVLPLLADFKGRVDGIVHESSGSGETLFVEPRELVDLNNRLAQTQNEIHREIRRVLRELTEEARTLLPDLDRLHAAVVDADMYVARARYGFEHGGRIIPTGETIRLHGARHPLLGQACVPLNIEYAVDTRLMVLSGPNTGGKTVLLKTLGLLAVMHQCGIPIPVDNDSTLPVFSWFGVDIGDEQSIDAALSTFSAHLRTLGTITQRADRDSLVLLDELGTGTDPEEGAALSMAIIDHLMEQGATILVTTHQTILKHYGYTREGASNAAMAFDEKEHRPTYRVIPGRPGGSYAIETAREQGLDSAIVERARSYHHDHHNSVAGIIARLVEEEDRLAQERRSLERVRRELDEEKRDAERARTEYEQQNRELKREGLARLNRSLSEARKAVEQEIRSVRERGREVGPEEIQRAHRSLDNLQRLRDETQTELDIASPVEQGEQSAIENPTPGLVVQHRATGRTGTILRVLADKIEVQFGAVRLSVTGDELVAAPETPQPERSGPVHTSARASRPTAPAIELDIRGYRLQAALDELENQIDAAVMHGLVQISVIHGTGTGVLQKGVQDYLRRREEVRSFHFARPEEGGFGKTVVEFSTNSGVG